MTTTTIDPARETALRFLHELEQEDTTIDRLFVALNEGPLDPRDRSFVRQLVLGTQRWRQRIDWIVDQFASKKIASCSPWARQILRLGTYQLLWLDRVPERAAVHTSVELAKRFTHQGIASFVNAILRQILRQEKNISYPSPQQDPAFYLAVYHSHPQWLVERWLARWGTQSTESLLTANNTQAPLYIRTNPLRATSAQLEEELEKTGHTLRACGPLPAYFSVEEIAGLFVSTAYTAGFFQVQDINAGLPAALLAPQAGQKVLDMCSAPGGKTTQLAEIMQDSGSIIAADTSLDRLRLVRENMQRLRLHSIRPLVQDATRDGPGDFDCILADVPCNNTGIFGRHPDARWRKNAEQLSALSATQQAILQRAFDRLKPGGVLVYSTCSLEAEENEEIVEHFLAATPNAHLEEASRYFPQQAWAGRYIQTLPGREPGDGCFAARIHKQER